MTTGPSSGGPLRLAEVDDVANFLQSVGFFHDPRSVLALDGRTGAGKSTTARRLLAAWQESAETAPTVLALDDLYDGWAGLRQGAELARRALLAHARGESTVLPRYDWDRGVYTEVFTLHPGPLLVEGCAAGWVTASHPHAVRCWIDTATTLREARVLSRDGEQHRADHRLWKAAEERFFVGAGPELAEIIVGR